MSDVYLDVAEASAAMRRVESDTRQRAAAHAAAPPAFPSAAAGRGFADAAQRLQSAFARVHERGAQRLDAVCATAAAAVEQYAVVDAANATSARRLDLLGEAL